MASGRSTARPASRIGLVVAASIGGLATLVAALITIWSSYSPQSPTSAAGEPTATITATATETVAPTETPTKGATPEVTVTVTAGPDIRVVLPSSLAISIDSGDAPAGDGNGGGNSAGLITAVGGFLTGVGAVITGFVTWLSLRRKRDDDDEDDSEGEPPEKTSPASESVPVSGSDTA